MKDMESITKRESFSQRKLNELSYTDYVRHKLSLGLTGEEAIRLADLRENGYYLASDTSGCCLRASPENLAMLAQDAREFARDARDFKL